MVISNNLQSIELIIFRSYPLFNSNGATYEKEHLNHNLCPDSPFAIS